jgi:hypothetical protein
MEPIGSRSNSSSTFQRPPAFSIGRNGSRVIRKAIGEVQRTQGKSASWRSYQNDQMKEWLWQGQVEKASARLQRWREQQAEEGRALHDAITYLHKQRAWIGSYEQWKAQGLPVGSGIIERAVSLVINRRDA